MLRGIQTHGLLLSRNTEHAQHLEDVEEGDHVASNPAKDDQDSNDLASEQLPASTLVESTVGVGSRVGVGSQGVSMGASIDLEDILLLSQQADKKHPPHAGKAVHGSSTKGIVNLELEEEDADKLEDNGSAGSVNNGSPRLNDVAAGGDSHKAAEDAIADRKEIPGLVAGKGPEEAGDTSGSTRQGSGDGSAPDDHGVVSGLDKHHGSRVESIPEGQRTRHWELMICKNIACTY